MLQMQHVYLLDRLRCKIKFLLPYITILVNYPYYSTYYFSNLRHETHRPTRFWLFFSSFSKDRNYIFAASKCQNLSSYLLPPRFKVLVSGGRILVSFLHTCMDVGIGIYKKADNSSKIHGCSAVNAVPRSWPQYSVSLVAFAPPQPIQNYRSSNCRFTSAQFIPR